MEIYVNGILRPDVLLETGGSMGAESSHTATSNVKLRTPVSSAPLSECDFIQFKEQNKVIYSGTIMQVKQDTFSILDLSFKSYELTISDNSELLSAVFADLKFQQNVNIMQIIFGNLPSHEWYDSNIPDFSGLSVKMDAEGITIGIVDDFSRFVLSEPANLWGMYIRDVLNSLSEITGAWWEITPDRVFNMRYPAAAAPAPINITGDSEIFNVSISRDAFSLYSAVRVVGGKGVGELLNVKLTSQDNSLIHDNAAVISTKKIQTKFPINSVPEYISIVNEGAAYEGKVGIKGIDDDKDYDAYYSYGSDIIEISNSSTWSFPAFDGSFSDDIVSFSYTPLVQIYFRMVDDELANEIKTQRGGTGIIEHVIDDNTIVTTHDAIAVAKAFLSENKKRAFTINFSTFIPGWTVGQTLIVGLPYYDVNGEFNVVALKKAPILQQDNSNVIRYDVTASTVALRDKYSKLFYTPKSIGFTIGTDCPNVQSYAFNNNIELISSVVLRKIRYPNWSDLNNRSWGRLMANYDTWGDFSDIFDQQEQEIHGLTEIGRNRIAYASGGKLQSGEPVQDMVPDLCHILVATGSNDQHLLTAESITVDAELSVTSVYHVGVDDVLDLISKVSYIDGDEEIQAFPVTFDKGIDNPDGKYEVYLAIKQIFAGKWLTAAGKNVLVDAIQNATNIFSLNGLTVFYTNSFGDLVCNIEPLVPSEVGGICAGSYTVSYYITEDDFAGTLQTLSYPDATVVIQSDIDHSADNPSGGYNLVLAITHNFI